jgi:hypothetical protein
MKAFLNLFTKERVILGIISALIGYAGIVYTARSEAASKTQEDLDAFKSATIADIGEIKGTVNEIRNRIEDIKGINQSMESRLNKFIDEYRR